jgi:hypothetical protein
MELMLLTLAVFQPARFWLKLDAELNMELMLLTDTVFQPARFWLKLDAELNMLLMLLTDTVFQPARFWLKLDAEENKPLMLPTLAVFQPARFWLKASAEASICEQKVQRCSQPTDLAQPACGTWLSHAKNPVGAAVRAPKLPSKARQEAGTDVTSVLQTRQRRKPRQKARCIGRSAAGLHDDP